MKQGVSTYLWNSFINHYQLFVIVWLIVKRLDIVDVDNNFRLITATPLFLMSYAHVLFPLLILMSIFDISTDLYWDLAVYYNLIIKVIVIGLAVGYLVFKKHKKKLCLHYILTVLKHNYFSVTLTFMISLYRIINENHGTVDYISVGVFGACLPIFFLTIAKLCKNWAEIIVYGLEDSNSFSSTLYKDIKMGTISIQFNSLLIARKTTLIAGTFGIIMSAHDDNNLVPMICGV
jgi:hypothetical protein